MPRESRPSARAANRTITNVSKGIVRAIRKTIPPNTKTPISLPTSIGYGVIRNTGPGSCEINFDSDLDTDFWSLANGEQTPTIQFTQDVTVNIKGSGGPVNIECLFWG